MALMRIIKIKYIGISLAKIVRELYVEKHSLKKLKKTQVNGKLFHFHGLEDLILLKYFSTHDMHRFNSIPLNIPMTLFKEVVKTILRLYETTNKSTLSEQS